ncbi:hypothetical protein K466DRAFT_605607 [Polyporus arcularius HHB13444]|uniref:Uncharacterized protein n=1 Tax=Polyporus arcularius HHB13444 TaxID=1314778 RepID=A0A5C3NRC0_9APHY|nr:hypothetical protein K466DRAFT_605607 [Polyporus arcularius HHB13444]
MDSDDSTTPSQSPRMAAAVLGSTATSVRTPPKTFSATLRRFSTISSLSTAPAPVSREGSPVALVHARVPAPAVPPTARGHGVAEAGDTEPLARQPEVVVTTGTRLTSAVTYSDLSGAYDTVNREFLASSTADVPISAYAPYRMVRLEEDSDSIAALVVSPNANTENQYTPEVAITHRKLRYLFRDALQWYLKKRGVSIDPTRLVVKVGDIGEAQYLANLPAGLAPMRVVGDGVTFDAPVAHFTAVPDVTGACVMTVLIAVALLAIALGSQADISRTKGDVTVWFASSINSSVSFSRSLAAVLRPYVLNLFDMVITGVLLAVCNVSVALSYLSGFLWEEVVQ